MVSARNTTNSDGFYFGMHDKPCIIHERFGGDVLVELNYPGRLGSVRVVSEWCVTSKPRHLSSWGSTTWVR